MTHNMPKGSRQGIEEDSYFMGRLLIESACCRDPEVQKAALIVSKGSVLSFGVNYIVREYVGTACSWNERGHALYTAEDMALDEALRQVGTSHTLMATTMYMTNPPTAASLIRCLRFDLKKIVYVVMNEAAIDFQDWAKAQAFGKEKHVELKPFEGNLNWMRDRIKKFSHLF